MHGALWMHVSVCLDVSCPFGIVLQGLKFVLIMSGAFSNKARGLRLMVNNSTYNCLVQMCGACMKGIVCTNEERRNALPQGNTAHY